jgi:tellurite resistance protein
MHPTAMSIVKSLVTVAWADGTYAEPEKEMVDALLEAFEASEEQAKEVRDYAATKRTLEDIPNDELGPDDCRQLLLHAVMLSYADGEQSPAESDLLKKLAAHLAIPPDEAEALMKQAEARAKKFLHLL